MGTVSGIVDWFLIVYFSIGAFFKNKLFSILFIIKVKINIDKNVFKTSSNTNKIKKLNCKKNTKLSIVLKLFQLMIALRMMNLKNKIWKHSDKTFKLVTNNGFNLHFDDNKLSINSFYRKKLLSWNWLQIDISDIAKFQIN